jgi:hypothetical protein
MLGGVMMRLVSDDKHAPCQPDRSSSETSAWKRTVSETFLALQIIPEKFNGKVVVTFKDGGVSYLEKTETFK